MAQVSAVRAEVFDRLKVAVRERPLSEVEKGSVQVMLRTDADKLIAFYPDAKEGLVYNYDYFFPEESTQVDVFKSIGVEMVDLVLAGFSSSCVTYGPSASGKTHTLFGSDQEPGLIQLTTKELFHRIGVMSEQSHNVSVKVSYWEMSCDAVRDSLSPVDSPSVHHVRRSPTEGFHVTGLTKLEVSTWEDFDDILMQGNIHRIQQSEQRNARWHGFVKLYLEFIDRNNADTMTMSTMTFAHLKGADRVGQKGAKGDVLKQGSNINKSISLLGSAMLHAVDFRRKSIKGAATEEDHRAIIEKSQSFFMECKFTQVVAQCICSSEACFVIGTLCTMDYHETTDTLETLQTAQQFSTSLKARVKLTQEGKLRRELSNVVSTVPEHSLAEGHPLSEIEERVQQLRAKLSGQPMDPAKSVVKKDILPVSIPPGAKLWQKGVLKGKIHGDRATIYIPNESGTNNTYQGQWCKGRKDGAGVHETATSKYEGHFLEGMRDGEGTLWLRADASSCAWNRVYKGAWRSDKRHGRGTNYYCNGDIYDGYFENGVRSTLGKWFLANGDRIEGQFHNDLVHGYATLYCKNGDQFDGEWYQGMREGEGQWLFSAKQQILFGQWHKNIAKCGELQDVEWKETNDASSFLPRVELKDPKRVLDGELRKLNVLRQREMDSKAGSYRPAARAEPKVYQDEDETNVHEQVSWN